MKNSMESLQRSPVSDQTETPLENKTDNNELREELISSERATELAEQTLEKINFLNSIKEKIHTGEDLTGEEQTEKERLFGDKDMNYLKGLSMTGLEEKRYQFLTAGINGAEHVEVAYPTGIYHKETEFEKWVKEHEQIVKELYHYAGTTIDRATETIITEYNSSTDPKEKIGHSEEEAHTRPWYHPEVFDEDGKKGLRFVFGATEYRLVKNTSGTWYVSIDKEGFSLTPKPVDDKFRELDRKVSSWLEEKANQTLT